VERLAREACEIEIDILGKPIGIQDQYIAAYGGLRFMEFSKNGQVHSRKIAIDATTKRRLNENLMLFYTGITRKSDAILLEQTNNIRNRIEVLNEMKAIAYQACDELESGRLDQFGRLLDETWQLKKQLASKISNNSFNDIYSAARSAGAIGGKITGAGGGGFMLLYCPKERQEAVRETLKNMQELPIRSEADGTKVIFNYQR
jgi:D-glycero-alpha-D-manno-heptose-7-phosphate kinase